MLIHSKQQHENSKNNIFVISNGTNYGDNASSVSYKEGIMLVFMFILKVQLLSYGSIQK